ncbi:MAG: hypothetical protein LWX09_07935 [Bacteroidia bacterium]|jgi:hypothetical protein|nr:hypothetical protein [Bacteroidia bacterium]
MKALTIRIAALSILVLIFIIFIFPAFTIFHNSGAGMLDSKFFYTPDQAFETLKKLGSTGRSSYYFVAGIVDMIYLLIYGRLFYLLIGALAVKNIRLRRLAWVPSILDSLENLITLTMLGMYPGFNRIIAATGGVINGLKWLAAASVVLIIIALFIRTLINRVSGKKQAKQNP